MSSKATGDDLVAEDTTGYKVSEKKTLDELQKLDENDGTFTPCSKYTRQKEY